jgi:uncharacterized MAPEG superfamily protein
MSPLLASPEACAAVRVTAGLLILYYILLFTQSYAKIYLLQGGRKFSPVSFGGVHYATPSVAAVKYFNSKDALAIVADRAVGNLHEQAWPFLISMWMRVLLVDGESELTGWLGWCYVLTRAVYPIFFCIGHPWLQVSTVPGYLIIWFFLSDVLRYACLDSPSDPNAVAIMVLMLAFIGLAGIAAAGITLRQLTSRTRE